MDCISDNKTTIALNMRSLSCLYFSDKGARFLKSKGPPRVVTFNVKQGVLRTFCHLDPQEIFSIVHNYLNMGFIKVKAH